MNRHPPRLLSGPTGMMIVVLFVCAGCNDAGSDDVPVARAAPVAAAVDAPPILSAAELRRRLGTDERAMFRRVGTDIVEVYLAGAGVKSIEPLQGLPLKVLDLGFCDSIDDISVVKGMPLKTLILEGTSVSDLTPITGMALETLHLQDTPVTDLSPIHGMPLRQLNLKGVAVDDVTPFAGMPLSTLWLLETNVTDISALRELTLESLDLQDTAVSDLSPLAHMTTLRRLNIAGTPVSDLRPVTGLRLERIFLSPDRITDGMNELRKIPSLGQIGTSHEHQFAAADFWERYDVGAWGSDRTKTDESAAQDTSAESTSETGSEPETTPATDSAADSTTGDSDTSKAVPPESNDAEKE